MAPADQPTTCPECGAPQVDGLTCWGQLEMLLAWEYQDPALQVEHFFTVAGYNLQHPAQFTAEAFAGLRTAFRERLDHGLPYTAIRQRANAAYNGRQRVLRPVAERQPVLRRWPLTIADVYRPDNPQGAAGRVRAWAAAIRRTFDE